MRFVQISSLIKIFTDSQLFHSKTKPFYLFYRNIFSDLKFFSQNNYDLFRNLSFDDTRLLKHLNVLKEKILKDDSNNLVDNKLKLQSLLPLLKEFERNKSELKELDLFITEIKKDEEILSTALSEKEELETNLQFCKHQILEYIIPEEIDDNKDIIMELSPGVGGQEAMLFTKDMFDMYFTFAAWKGWKCELIKYEGTDLDGIRSAHLSITGPNAYKTLKFESGVHRVQRIPKTEKAGRIHTSTMTVAVLPQPSEIDIVINPHDLDIQFKRSSGAGGQNVNKTESCVRIVHKPTGIAVENQMERFQYLNKELALKSLRAKLYQRELENMQKDINRSRKQQIGSAGRSEKVRTYNFIQDRITDHRAHINYYNVEAFFKGKEELNNFLNKLQMWSTIQSINDILEQYDT